MKTSLLISLSLATLALAACGNPPGAASYVDTDGPHTLVNIDKINVQDFDSAASKLVQQLINSGVLENAPSKPAIMAISRMVNNSDFQFDMDQFTNNIRIELLNTGKIQTTTTLGLNGNVQDPLAAGLQDKNAFLNGQQAPNRTADYTLTGKILSDKSQAGSTRQSTYTFYLTLTDVRTGLGVWEGKQAITKQGTQQSIGF